MVKADDRMDIMLANLLQKYSDFGWLCRVDE